MSSFSNTYFEMRTQYYSGVTTAGSAVSFNKPVSMVYIRADGEFTITGNAQDTSAAAAAAPLDYLDGWMPLPIGDPVGDSRTLFTVKAVSGTINVTVVGFY